MNNAGNTAWTHRVAWPALAIIAITVADRRCASAHDDGKGVHESAPAGTGAAGPFPHEGLEILSHLPLSEIGGENAGVLGSDIWGWTDPTSGREFAIFGLVNGTSFVEITQPAAPVFLGKLPSATGSSVMRDMKTYGNYLYVVADNNGPHGVQVFDLTKLLHVTAPTTFTESGHASQITNAHNLAINEQTGFAYAVGSNRASGGLVFFDLAAPTEPALVGEFSRTGYIHDTQVILYDGPDEDYAGREIAFNSNISALTVVDVTDKTDANLISIGRYPNSEYTHQGWLSEDRRYFFADDELDERDLGHPRTRTHIWDVSDLDAPAYLGFHEGVEGTIDHNQYVKGDYLYQANYTGGLRVLEIVDPANAVLEEVAFLDTYPIDNLVTFNGAWSVYPFFESGSIIVGDRQTGLFVAKLTEASLSADFDANGVVDGEDFLIWQIGFGSALTSNGDADGDGDVDGDDFLIWQEEFTGDGGGSLAIPEPASMSTLAIVLCGILLGSRHGRPAQAIVAANL